jgi:hypothetical protein
VAPRFARRYITAVARAPRQRRGAVRIARPVLAAAACQFATDLTSAAEFRALTSEARRRSCRSATGS